ncbi:MAG: RHS repeat protein, partial [Clostridia bacterium]|nr:RHS repeat protein [Clostridia bacterium]
ASSDLAILRKREIESRNTYGGLYEYEATVDEVDTETTIAVNYHYASELTSMNYHQTRSNLGIGWSWAFPSVQVIKNDYNNVNEEPKAIYYHDGHGRVLEVSVDGNNNCYFTNYIGEDISFEKCIHDDFANFSTKRIDYIVEDSDCTNYYFGPHGEIRSIIDIHGNKMEFEYTYTSFYGANSMPLISGITDSVGRYVDFEYTSNGMNEYIEVTVTSPFEAENELTLSYQKISENMYSEKISANSGNENSTYISNASFLQSVTYPNGDTTEYYPIQSEEDSNVVPTYFSFADKRLNSEFVYATGGYISNPVYLLGAIVRENSYTGYEYEVCTLNLGHSGVCTSFRVTERSDNLLVLAEITTDNNTTIYEASPGQIFNRVCYGYNDDISDYSHNYSGYPYYVDSEEISEDSNVCDTEVVYESSQHTYFYHKTDGAILNTKIYSEYFNPIGDDLTVVTKIESFYEKIPEITLITYSNESEYTYSSHKYANISSVHNKFFGKPWLVTDEMPVNSSEYIKYKQGISYEYDNYTGYILSKSWYQSDNVQCTENYTYTSDGRPMSFTAADGTGVTYAYEYTDGKVSKITETTLNDTGKTVIVKTYTAATNYAFPSIVQKSVTSNGSTSTETTSYTYDMLLGTVKTMTDNDGNTTFYEYDSVGRVTRIIYPVYFAYGSYSSKNTKILPIDVFTYANTVISHEMVNSADGELAVTLTEQITRYYDVTETDVSYPPSVDTSALSTTFSDIKREYHIGTGELVKSEWLDVTNNQYAINSNTYSFNTNTNTSTVTDSLGDTVTTYYDGMGREVKIKDKFDNFHITEYNRSGDGAGFNVLAYFSTDSTGANKENVKEYTYDRLGRILSEKAYSDYPNNFVESKYSYDLAGNVIGITDANGNLNKDGFTQTNAYDKLNRLISSKNANNEIVTNNYDNLGNIKNQSLTSKSGVTHTLYDRSYTGDGKILSDTDNSQNSNTYSYDSMGRLTEVTDKDLKTSSFSYNELGINDTQTHIKPDTVASMKREAVFNPYGADVVYNLSGTYDTENEAFALGLSEISQHIYSPTGNILYEESEYATSTGTTETFNPISEYIYDSEGKLTAQLHGVSGSETNTVRGAFTLYEYDKSRLLKVQINGSNVKNSSDNANVRYEYYDDGKLKTVIYPTLADGSVLKSEYEYDGLSRLTSLINYKDTQVLSSYFYTYDN